MKRLITILLLSALLSPAIADETPSVMTSAPNGRFEIVQSAHDQDDIIKLDKLTGRTWRAYYCLGKTIWKEILRKDFKFEGYDNGINYQVFFSANSAHHCYLLDVNNGDTWLLKLKPDGTYFWWKVE